ncbi:MAG: GTP-binding protein EngB [Methanosarcinaceae archaeon]|nr:GTP-binding protein EngB [Methanosarcinaceae archaeon]
MTKKQTSLKKIGFEIILAGRSNVGKSSLVREITGQKIKVGKRPGVTLKPKHVHHSDMLITDLPGFGFMSGVKERKQDIVKDQIVRYIEENNERINVAVLVLDGGPFIDVVDRWGAKNEIPIDVEIFDLFHELGIDTIVAVNKMDRIKTQDHDVVLDGIVERLGLFPPWRQWNNMIAPVSAKKGDMENLESLLRKRLHAAKRDDLLKYI